MQISFYHLTATPLERALPKLLEKAYGSGLRTCVWCAGDAQAEQLDQLLWTYDAASFLPHGTMKDAAAEQQPVLLATQPEPTNGANALFVLCGAPAPAASTYERLFDLFDGNNAEATASARERWKHYKDAGHNLSYFKQTENGSWEKAA
jgi:DNA polymerase-3 subunit chi